MMVLRPKPSIRRSSHNQSHGCPFTCAVPFTEAVGAKVGERARCGLLLGLPGQGVAHSTMVAAAKGRQQSAASLLLDLDKFYKHVGHDHLWEEGRKTSFPRRLLACWCASYEGWRFLDATFPFWAFLATLLETVSTRLLQALERCRRHFGPLAASPKMVQVLPAEGAWLLVEGLQARDLPLSKGKSKVLIDGTDKLRHEIFRQLDGTQRWGRAAAGQAAAGARRQGAAGRGSEAHETRQAAAEGRGTHSQSDPHWLECGGALGVPRFWASLQHSSKPSE